MILPKITDYQFQDKKVLVRADLDLVLTNGRVSDDSRLRALLPTLEHLLYQEAKVILIGHLGRPGGKVVKRLSLKPVAQRLKELLDDQSPITTCQLRNFQAFKISENLSLLENLRFYPGEEENDQNFARELACLGNFYINEAFAASHREQASIVGVAKLLPHAIGFNFDQEVENLSKIFKNPPKPIVFVIGGAKVETKLPVIANLFERVDIFLLGGVVANTFMVVEPNHPKIIGQSVFDGQLLDEAKKILAKGRGEKIEFPGLGKIWKIKIPASVVIAQKETNNFSGIEEVEIGGKSGEVFNQKKMIVDIGFQAGELYGKIIKQAGTVIFAGPMGLIEKEAFSHGTKAVLEAMAKSSAYKVAGGGDTIAALNKFRLLSKMDFVSLGGGAMLEYLAKGSLPGIEALK